MNTTCLIKYETFPGDLGSHIVSKTYLIGFLWYWRVHIMIGKDERIILSGESPQKVLKMPEIQRFKVFEYSFINVLQINFSLIINVFRLFFYFKHQLNCTIMNTNKNINITTFRTKKIAAFHPFHHILISIKEQVIKGVLSVCCFRQTTDAT